MIDLEQIEEYIISNGVPATRPIYADGQKLRVMDLTSLPEIMRSHFDERGFYKPSAEPKKQGEEKK